MKWRATGLAAIAVWALLALPALRAYADSAELGAAVALYDDLEYEKAIVALDAAVAQPGLTPAELLTAHRYRLLSYVALGREDDARKAAGDLLAVDRTFELPRTESPRARDILAEVRASLPALVVEVQPVSLTTSVTPLSPKKGTPVTIKIAMRDPDGRHKKVLVRHRVRGEQGYSTVRPRPLVSGDYDATIPGAFVRGAALEYYVVAEDARGVQLAAEGSAAEPLELTLVRGKKGGGVLGKWWFWAAVGGVAIIGTGAVLLAGDSGGGGNSDATVTVTVNLMP